MLRQSNNFEQKREGFEFCFLTCATHLNAKSVGDVARATKDVSFDCESNAGNSSVKLSISVINKVIAIFRQFSPHFVSFRHFSSTEAKFCMNLFGFNGVKRKKHEPVLERTFSFLGGVSSETLLSDSLGLLIDLVIVGSKQIDVVIVIACVTIRHRSSGSVAVDWLFHTGKAVTNK